MSASYASSTALSPAHYRLVTALEAASSPAATERFITQELARIRRALNGALSPKATRIELLIALYCKNSSELPSSSDAHNLSFCLPAAVKLAGGGKEAKLRDRRIGLRFCDEVFTEQPHPLKLLLINTIRSDLYVPSHSPQAEARWVMGLRAAACPRLLTDDLVPAISARVVELFASRSSPIRRMALASLLSLSTSELGSTRDRTRSLVRDSLAPPPHLVSKKQPQRQLRGPEPDPRTVCALVEAVGRGSPIYPVAEGEELVAIYLSVLRRLVAGEWREFKWEYHGVACGWLGSKVLDGLKEELHVGSVNESTRDQVLNGVLAYLDTILTKVDLGFGLLLSSLACFATLPATAFQSLDAENASIVSRSLEAVLHHLNSKNPNLQVLALRCLCKIPVDVWSSAAGWSENAWVRIMSFLDSRDSTVRKATLAVLHHADPSLATLHISRLLQALSSLPAPSHPKEFITRDHILSLLLEASAVVDNSPEAWAARIDTVVSTARGTRQAAREVFGVVVVGTIDRFSYASEEAQAAFSETLLGKETWRNDLSMALLVAATAGGGTTSEARREEVAEELATWLANEDGQLPSDFLQPLQEPFLLCLLRLASRAPPSSFSKVESYLKIAAQAVPSDEGQPLFDLFFRCQSDPTSRHALEAAGTDPRSASLPGFFTALQEHLERPAPRDSVDEALSPSSRPLRYDAYQAPVSPSVGREGMRWKGNERERTERGGRGGMAESLMTPGALALIGADGNDEQGSSDGESDSSRSHFRRATRAPVGVGVGEEVGTEDADVPTLQLRGRRGSWADGPPADLLIELGAAAVDPFHDGT